MKGKPMRRKIQHVTPLDVHVAYAVSHCETWLDIYARGLEVPRAFFAERVATTLLSQAGGKILGPEDSLPALPGQTSEGNQTLAPLALARRPHRNPSRKRAARSMSKAARARIGRGIRKYWRERRKAERSS